MWNSRLKGQIFSLRDKISILYIIPTLLVNSKHSIYLHTWKTRESTGWSALKHPKCTLSGRVMRWGQTHPEVRLNHTRRAKGRKRQHITPMLSGWWTWESLMTPLWNRYEIKWNGPGLFKGEDEPPGRLTIQDNMIHCEQWYHSWPNPTVPNTVCPQCIVVPTALRG